MNDTRSDTKLSYCIKSIETLEADHEVCREKFLSCKVISGRCWLINFGRSTLYKLCAFPVRICIPGEDMHSW